MRSRCLCVALILASFGTAAIAQSVIVKPRRVIYRRTGTAVPDFKRTFAVRYPEFSGMLTGSSLINLRSGTNYWRIFDTTLAENLKDDHWLSSFDYTVNYNKYNILDISLFMEGVGAYPDGVTKFLVFDIRTGRKLDYSDLFTRANLPDLLSKIRSVMKRTEEAALKASDEMRGVLADYRENSPEFHPSPDKIEFKDLQGFGINDSGVTFQYDYGYPHVAEALEPSGEFFISYRELKPFIRTDGLLARFIR
jgi:hypothetical protein